MKPIVSIFIFTILISACSTISNANAQGLVFPMQGNWGALQGPPCPAPANHHCGTANQQFAYDFVPVNSMGLPNPAACIGQPIISPADGVVVVALDIYPNTPNAGQHIAGNHVVIQRGPSEYILIAHLSPGSVQVPTGSRVNAGQLIGTCGFNGSTSAPHVHIHMQSGPQILAMNTPGLPMFFQTNVWNPMTNSCAPLGGHVLTRGMIIC